MNDNNKTKPWWQPGIIMFLRVSIWVAIPVILALYIGKYLDRYFDTRPWIFLILTGIAFIISMFGIWKMLKKYIKNIETEAKQKKLNQNGESNNTN